MTFGQDVDAMVEARNAAEWEAQTAPVIDGETARQAGMLLRMTAEELDKTLDLLNEAAEALVDTPDGDRISSMLNEMEDRLSEIRAKRDEFERRAG